MGIHLNQPVRMLAQNGEKHTHTHTHNASEECKDSSLFRQLASSELSCEVDPSQRGRKHLNAETEEPLLGTAQGRHGRLRRLSARCSELRSVWISDSAVINCTYELCTRARVQ
jgi:hypothetical protein